MASRFSRPGYGPQSHQEITTQAQVTSNHYADPNEINRRKQIVSSLMPGQYIPGRLDDHGLNVDRGEIAIIEKTQQVPGTNRVAFRSSAFTSFNGYPTYDVSHQDLFEDRFTAVGVVTGSLDFTGDEPNRSGFAVHSAGSISIVNSSGEPLNSGDYVRWCAPALNAEERKRQYFSVDFRRAGDFSTKEKYTATIARIQYTDIAKKFETVASHLVNENKNIRIHDFRAKLLRGIIDDKHPVHTQAILFKQFITAIAYHTLILAFQRGYVTPTLPASTGSTKASENAAAMNAWLLRREKIKQKTSNWKLFDANGTQLDGDQQKVRLREMESFADVVAASLGLIGPLRNGGVTEDINFTGLLATRSLYGSLGPIENPQRMIETVFNEFQTPPSDYVNSVGIVNAYYHNIPKQIRLITGDAATQHIRACGQQFDRIYSTAFAQVSSPSLPNAHAHLILH